MKKHLQFICCMTAILCAAATVLAQTPGALKWAFTTGDVVYSSPAIGADGTIYVGSNDGKLYAINPDGTQKWAFTTGGPIFYSSPAIGADGTIYVGSFNGNLYAINPDGSQKWAFRIGPLFFLSSPAIDIDGNIYVGSILDRKLYAINPDGTQKWAFATGDAVASSPAIGVEGTIYVGSNDGKLYAINPDGTQKWAFTTGGSVGSSPAIGVDGTIYVGSFDEKLYAVNRNGTLKWAFTTADKIASSPSIGQDGTIYVGSRDDKIYALNPDGTLKWAFTTAADVESSPAVGADGTIHVGSDKIYALNPDGTLMWAFGTGSGSSPAIGTDGTVYVGGSDNKLYAIHTTSKGLAPSSWPKFRGGNRNEGRIPPPNIDVGVSKIDIPSLIKVGDSTPITVVVGNFGITPQSNFTVSYRINSGPEVTEVFAGTLAPGASDSHTFVTPWVPAAFGVTDTIKARTSLTGDERPDNDEFTKTVLVTENPITCSTDVPKIFLGASTATSTLTINDDLRIGDVNVRLHITHSTDTDLDVFLTSPSGTKVELFTDVGGSGDNFGSTCSVLPDCIIDDQAATNIAGGSAPFVGSFRSESRMLGTFNGENAKGVWTLTVTVDASGSFGALNCWCLEIKQAPPNDVGITIIDLPRVLTLGNALEAKVTVKNFGTAAQSNFPVRYSVNNTPAVTENFTGSLAVGTSAAKTFALWKPDVEGNYRFTAWTELSGDQNKSNDTLPTPKSVLVRKTNTPPVLASLSHQTVRAGRAKRLLLSVMDVEADTVSFSIPTNPGFLSISGVTRTGNVTTASLVILPSWNQKGLFNAFVQVNAIDGESSSAFNIEVVPATLNPPRNLAASDAGNAVTLNWEAPVPAQISPYAGVWRGNTSQSHPAYMNVADDGFIDSLNVRFTVSFLGCTASLDFRRNDAVEIKNAKFDAFLSGQPITSVSTTLHGTFASESSVSGTYDESSGGGFIFCGSSFIFQIGGTQLSAGNWQANKTGPGTSILAVLQSFNIYRSSQPNARTTGVLIGTLNASTRTFTDSNPSAGAIYYQITAKYDLGESDPTNEAGLRTRVEERIADLPITYALEQNYPNPFNPETTVRFQLPKAGQVVLKIFNILGAEVRTLVDAPYEAGYHHARWDGKDKNGHPVASGVYLYQLRAGDFSQVKKMSLLR